MSVINPNETGRSARAHAGDLSGPNVAPLAIVLLTELAFEPITTALFDADIAMPGFRPALTVEAGFETAAKPMNR